jgi:hypothetical protein
MEGMQCIHCVAKREKFGSKVAEVPAVMCCAWCGSTDAVHCVISKSLEFMHFDFCNRSCIEKYKQFVHSGRVYSGEQTVCIDMTNGVPFCFTGRHPDQEHPDWLECGYCGIQCKRGVVLNPTVPNCYKQKTFCENDVCLNTYLQYTKIKPIE